jgi:hypothetical protein
VHASFVVRGNRLGIVEKIAPQSRAPICCPIRIIVGLQSTAVFIHSEEASKAS